MKNDYTSPLPALAHPLCVADCTLSAAILCHLRHERALLTDLAKAEATGSVDADVLRCDLRRIGDRLTTLLLLGMEARRMEQAA